MTDASAATIDGQPVSDAAFDAFEKGLTNRRQVVVCAETTTGGYSSYEATDARGIRFTVGSESRNGKNLREAVRALVP